MRITTELFDYQASAVEKLSCVKVGALYMEMGTGKTRTALELIQRRLARGKVSQVLWLCPYSCVKDLPELLSEHAEQFENIIRIAGIESLSSSLKLYAELWQYVEKAPTYLIVDESLLIKNPFAYRTEHITAIANKCKFKLILNGTPVSKSEADLFAQWYVLDWRILGYRSYYSFAANHIEFDKDYPDKIIRALNVDYLAKKIAPYTFECKKSDVMSLPNKRQKNMYFSLNREQLDHYDVMADRLMPDMDKISSTAIYRLFYALQSITSGFAVLTEASGKLSRYTMMQPEDNPRIHCLRGVLQKIGNEQAIIYCHYTQEIKSIMEVLGVTAAPFYGEMTRNARQANKTLFKNGEVQYLVANKSCAQFGLNLQFCRNVVFYNNDWDWATRAQAEDRVHRVGQTRQVNIWDILAQDTIDITIAKCMDRKEQLVEKFKNSVRTHNDAKKALLCAVRGLEDANAKGIS